MAQSESADKTKSERIKRRKDMAKSPIDKLWEKHLLGQDFGKIDDKSADYILKEVEKIEDEDKEFADSLNDD